jgi:hypothetical protein
MPPLGASIHFKGNDIFLGAKAQGILYRVDLTKFCVDGNSCSSINLPTWAIAVIAVAIFLIFMGVIMFVIIKKRAHVKRRENWRLSRTMDYPPINYQTIPNDI